MKKQLNRVLSLLLVFVMLLSMAACGQGNPTTGTPTSPTDPTPPKDNGTKTLTIYWNYDGDLSTASFWVWPEGGDGYSYPVEACDYGAKCVVEIPEDVTRVGFIAVYDCTSVGGNSWPGGTKDYDGDRFVDMNGDVTIYLKRGDEMIYYSKEAANTAQAVIRFAGMASLTTIKYNLPEATRITSLDQIKVMAGDRQIPVTGLSSLNNKVTHGIVTVAEELDLSQTYTLEIEGLEAKTVVPTTVFDSEEFISKYTYDGNDLGATINGDGSTTFKVWAPTASKVVLNLFAAGNEVAAYQNLEMTKADRGVWELNVPETGHGTYYTYSVTTAVGTQEAVDPYAKACGVNGNRGMVVDLDSTDPADWANDKVVTLEKYTDATIWEIHVRDFSNTISSSQYQGKYLAFTEHGLTNASGVPVGVDYLLNLGVTHLHLLPVYDYASVDETTCNTFNWGYDPKNYNCLEGSYSTDPYHGEVRINEFKQMVQSLHADGLGVIMDVVYNHTYEANSNLNKIVPYYYYRYDTTGKNTNKSGCGNDTASERYMYRKYMVDSVSYLASEYNLDGFRFDLMGLHDVETMQAIEKAVHAINPNAIIYGEAWDMAGTTTSATMMTQANAKKVTATAGAAGAVAVFNDTTRDGLKGSVWDAIPHGYINGNASGNSAAVQFGISGATTTNPWQVVDANVINYMSCHDNMTLWDILELSCPDSTVEDLLIRNRLGIGVLMVSQGVPFWQAGEEMLRTKDGNHNSYNASDAINNINWDVLTADSGEYAMMEYYKGLIEMRKAYEIFRSNDSTILTFGKLPAGGMTVSYKDANGNEALVLINPAAKADTFTLKGEWKLIVDATRSGSEILSTESGEVTVVACSIMVFVK